MCGNGDKIEKSECADHLGHRISTADKRSMCKSAIASFGDWRNSRNLCGYENILTDIYESIMQDELCENVSLKEVVNVRDGHHVCRY